MRMQVSVFEIGSLPGKTWWGKLQACFWVSDTHDVSESSWEEGPNRKIGTVSWSARSNMCWKEMVMHYFKVQKRYCTCNHRVKGIIPVWSNRQDQASAQSLRRSHGMPQLLDITSLKRTQERNTENAREFSFSFVNCLSCVPFPTIFLHHQ